jgi:hypothetical protein
LLRSSSTFSLGAKEVGAPGPEGSIRLAFSSRPQVQTSRWVNDRAMRFMRNIFEFYRFDSGQQFGVANAALSGMPEIVGKYREMTKI